MEENQYLIQNYILVVTPKKRSQEGSVLKKRYKGRKLTTESRFVELETLKVRAK